MGGPPGEPGRPGLPPSRRWGRLRHYQPVSRDGQDGLPTAAGERTVGGAGRRTSRDGWPAPPRGVSPTGCGWWRKPGAPGHRSLMLSCVCFFYRVGGGPPVSPVRIRGDTAGRRHPLVHPGVAAHLMWLPGGWARGMVIPGWRPPLLAGAPGSGTPPAAHIIGWYRMVFRRRPAVPYGFSAGRCRHIGACPGVCSGGVRII